MPEQLDLQPTDVVLEAPHYVVVVNSGGSNKAEGGDADTTNSIALIDPMLIKDGSGIVARIGVTVRDHDAAPATLVREAEAGAYAADPGDVQFAD